MRSDIGHPSKMRHVRLELQEESSVPLEHILGSLLMLVAEKRQRGRATLCKVIPSLDCECRQSALKVHTPEARAWSAASTTQRFAFSAYISGSPRHAAWSIWNLRMSRSESNAVLACFTILGLALCTCRSNSVALQVRFGNGTGPTPSPQAKMELLKRCFFPHIVRSRFV